MVEGTAEAEVTGLRCAAPSPHARAEAVERLAVVVAPGTSRILAGRLVDAVGGEPLALAVLEARLQLLTAEALAERLSADGLATALLFPEPAVTGDPATALAAATDAVIAALPPQARAAAGVLAAFAGAAPTDAVEQIINAALGEASGAALSALQALVARGVLHPSPAGLGLHPLLRLRLRQRPPDAAMAASAGLAHARFFGNLGLHGVVDGVERGDDAALARLRALVWELRAAAEATDPAAALGAAVALAEIATQPEDRVAARARLEAMAAAVADLSAPLRHRWLLTRARLTAFLGDVPGGLALLDGQPPDDSLAGRHAWAVERGGMLTTLQALDQATAQLATARETAQALDDPRREVRVLINQSNVYVWQGDLERARVLCREGQRVATALGTDRFLRVATANLAFIEGRLGNVEAARAAGTTALAAARRLGDRYAEIGALQYLGMLAINAGDLAEAARCYEASRLLHLASGQLNQVAFAVTNLAEVALETGDRAAAQRALDEVARLSEPPDPGRVASGDTWRPQDWPNVRASRWLLLGRLAVEAPEPDPDAAERHWQQALATLPAGASLADLRVEIELWRAQCGPLAVRDAARAAAVGAVAEAATPAWREAVDLLVAPIDDAAAWRVVLAPPPGRSGVAGHVGVRRVARRRWAEVPAALRRGLWAEAVDPSGQRLLLDPGLCAARAPGGAWVDLASRQLLWRLLDLLAHRAEHDLGPADLATVTEALWPGERALPDAMANRIYNAVTLLRQRGLSAQLERAPEGYALRGAVPLRAPPLDDVLAVARAVGQLRPHGGDS